MSQETSKLFDFSLVEKLAKKEYSRHNEEIILQYGTAGFRSIADLLDHVLFRMGLLAVLRSHLKKADIGLMITASHNPEEDNGVKIVDPSGEMLESSWETIATKLANVNDDEVVPMLREIMKEQKIDTDFPASIIIGRDLRTSSSRLSLAAAEGVKALNGIAKDVGLVTTPQLHYLVVSTNTKGLYGAPTIEHYYDKISKAFKTIVESETNSDKYSAKLQLDAANGIGAIAAKNFQKQLAGILEIIVYNDGITNANYLCGADYVKIQQKPPVNVPVIPYVKCVSVDGDADRIVYYYTDEQNQFHLLDGDRIAILVAEYLKELLTRSNLDLRLGLVQTAYANGGSTAYISETLKVPVACVPTGVKHLHHKAIEFDIGVYFEANGHGTVVFKDSAQRTIQVAAQNNSLSKKEQKAALTLHRVIDVINQTVGDALSDMLLVELILRAKGWDAVAWEKCYQDLPNKQVKVKVQDRNAITTTDAERSCVTPKGLQAEINKIVSKYPRGRSFVRPSGTEDVVRVYVECENASDVETFADEVSSMVNRFAGGM